MGSLDPEDRRGEPVELRSEAERFTSLLGGNGGGVLSGSIGVVEPACEKAIEPLEYETAAEPGRDMGVWLDSRELDKLLDKRRIHDRGRAFGVPARNALPSSRSATRSGACSAAMLMLKVVVGVSVLFCPTLAPPEPVFPFGPSLTERGVCGVEEAKGELRLG